MSEPNSEQQQEGEAERKIRQIFQEELKKINLSPTSSTLSAPSNTELKSPAQAGTEHKHFTAEEAFKNDCPDCVNIKTQIGKKYLQEELKRRMSNPYECEDCGTRISKEELDKEDCPTCGSKKARNR